MSFKFFFLFISIAANSMMRVVLALLVKNVQGYDESSVRGSLEHEVE